MPPKPVYASNKDLLKEIHNSKKTYCWFEKPEYADFDLIVYSLDEITQEAIDLVIEKKANPKGKITPVICSKEDLVFRVMTYDHIPLDPDRKRKARNTGDITYTRTNFPSFKHYIWMSGTGFVEVARSHWKGDLETGVFCVDHGHMTNTLARMFMLIVERYSRKGNWRAYSYNDEMRSLALVQLSQIGLQFDEAKSENPFAFYTTVIKNSFTRHLNLERRNQNIRDDLMIFAGALPSYTRQIEHEMERKFPADPAPAKKRPGRKPAAVKKAEIEREAKDKENNHNH